MKPCHDVPPALVIIAEQAEQRKDASLDRLLKQVAPSDAFERAMVAVIDADRAALAAKGK